MRLVSEEEKLLLLPISKSATIKFTHFSQSGRKFISMHETTKGQSEIYIIPIYLTLMCSVNQSL